MAVIFSGCHHVGCLWVIGNFYNHWRLVFASTNGCGSWISDDHPWAVADIGDRGCARHRRSRTHSVYVPTSGWVCRNDPRCVLAYAKGVGCLIAVLMKEVLGEDYHAYRL